VLEQARRTVVRSFMGFGSNALCRTVKSGFRSNSNQSGTSPARDWLNYPAELDTLCKRLQGVVIENKPAADLIAAHYSPETLFYCDPPYVHSSRTTYAGSGARKGYTHEMTDEDHRRLGAMLIGVKGKVVLSGYPCALYEELFANWRRVESKALADGARERTEVLWMNFESEYLL
jgi:DNA adenine methylase